MAKKQKQASSADKRPLGDQKSWARTNGTYLAGRAYIDGADETAAAMETKWGADRLRLLVSPELREKFGRQRYLFNQAIWHGDLEARREAGRMVTAWTVLDRAAEAAGAWQLSPEGRVRDDAHASLVRAEGREAVVYTLEKIGRLLSSHPDIAQVKILIPDRDQAQVRRRSARRARGQQGRSLLAVQYGLSQRDYHKRRKIEQGEMV